MPEVIEWKNPKPDDIVYKYPDEVITWGAQLIVHEYEVAVFFRDGKVYDVLGPGRHTITTQNLPLLTEVLSRLAGFPESPFKATIIFISTKQHQGRFGGQTQTTDLAPLKFHGSFWFRVSDPKVFVMEVVGGQSRYTTEDVSEFIRGFINERLIKHLAGYDLATVFTRIDEVTFKTKAFLYEEMKRLGLELIDLKFEGLDTTPEYRERLFWIKQTGAAAYVLQTDTLREVARELGKSPGAALGAGMMIIPPLTQPPPQVTPPAAPVAPAQPTPPTAPSKTCPRCNRVVPSDALFCPYCGQRLTPTKKCPKCNKDVPADAAFCPYCGTKLV